MGLECYMLRLPRMTIEIQFKKGKKDVLKNKRLLQWKLMYMRMEKITYSKKL